MLFKNGNSYKMSDEEKDILRKKFHFPLRLVYPSELIKPSRLNRLPDKPNSISMQMRVVIRNKDGETEEWRWSNNTTLTASNQVKYFPRRWTFQGNAAVQETDLELLYFLYWKSPHCKNGGLDEGQRKKAFFEIEDLVKIANDKVATKSISARYEVMVYDKDLGLPEHRLRSLAKAYFIPRVDDLELAQVRVAIDHEVRRDRRNGIQNFFELSKSDDYILMRSKLQVAIDEELVIFVPRDRVWAWRGDPEMGQNKRMEDICKVLSKAEPKQALIDWYENNLDFKNRLNHELEELSAMEPPEKGAEMSSTAEEVK